MCYPRRAKKAANARAATLLVDLGLGALVGATVAWLSGRLLAQSTLLRSASLWALVIYQLFVAVPVALLLSARFPMWRVLNLFEAQPRTAMILTSLGPIVSIVAFWGTRHALLAGKRRNAMYIIAAAAALLVAAATTFALAKRAGPVASESGRSLNHLAIGGLIACIIGWGLMLWRVRLLASSERTAASVTQLPAPARDGRTKPLEVARKSGGKR